MSYCKNCDKVVNNCSCENPNWVDEDGDSFDYSESINEKVDRIVRNGGKITDKRDRGGFMGCGFEYVAGDPEW